MNPRTRTLLRLSAALVAAALIAYAVVGKRLASHVAPSAPKETASATTSAKSAEPKILYWYDPMHPAYRSDKPGTAPDCGMALVPMYESTTPADQTTTEANLIHMPAGQQHALGVRITTVATEEVSRTLRTSGVVTPDETRIQHMHVKTAGWVEEVYADFVGQLVRRGQPLFTVYSPDLVATEQEYLIARRGAQKLGQSQYEEVARSSRSLVEAARERLKLWDMSDEQIMKLDRTGEVSRTVTIYSPVAGFITDRKAFPHTSTDPNTELYTIADLSRVWVTADVFEADLPYVKVGQTATIHFPYAPGKPIIGRVGYSYPVLDPQTHTAKIRIEVANPGLVLKPNMLADVELEIRYGKHMVVPAEAVLNSGTVQTVFVAKDETTFEPREVEIGATVDGRTIITRGLHDGDSIVESGNFLLDSDSRLNTPSNPGGAK